MTAPTDSIDDEPLVLSFVCVRNAGRSQMATAFAEHERDRRGLDDRVEVRTGGTAPADEVHPVVVEALAEIGLDVSGRTPREISDESLAESDFVATMGCPTLELETVDTDDWGLDDPGERPVEEVREIRDEIERRVVGVFDERFGALDDER